MELYTAHTNKTQFSASRRFECVLLYSSSDMMLVCLVQIIIIITLLSLLL